VRNNIIRYACLVALCGLAGAAAFWMPPEASAVGSDSGRRHYAFGAVGVGRGQGMRITVVRPDHARPAVTPVAADAPISPPVPDLPDKVRVVLYDAAGVILSQDDRNLPAGGRAYTFEVARDSVPMTGQASTGTLTMRAEVLISPPRRMGRLGAETELVTLEVFDTVSGRTAVRDAAPKLVDLPAAAEL
jgi:hypothetical protein